MLNKTSFGAVYVWRKSFTKSEMQRFVMKKKHNLFTSLLVVILGNEMSFQNLGLDQIFQV